MEKVKRNERMTIIIRILSQQPNRLFALSYFCNLFGASKSTISEDIAIARGYLEKYQLGELESVAGAAGGIRFTARPSRKGASQFIQDVCRQLCDHSRILPGGFLYTIDLLSDPSYVVPMGEIFVDIFADCGADFIATVETKGIPLAMATAREMGKPLVILSRDSKPTEGSVVTINYVSGSRDRIQTMSLTRRAVKSGQKALIIDDFMKGGGTARAIHDILREFDVEVVGTGVAISTLEPRTKRVEEYVSLMELEDVDENKQIISIRPADWLSSNR